MINVKKTSLIMILSVVVQIGMIGCGTSESHGTDVGTIPPPTTASIPTKGTETPAKQTDETQIFVLNDYERTIIENHKFLSSYEGNLLQAAAYSFFRAFVLADSDGINSMLLDPNAEWLLSEVPDNARSLDDCYHLVQKGFSRYTIDDKEIFEIIYEMGFNEGDPDGVIRLFYLSIEMVLDDGNWKVYNYYVQA